MVKIGLEFQANLENVKSLHTFGPTFRWYFKPRCANCGEVPDLWQYVTLEMVAELKGGRGTTSMVEKCKLCARDNSIHVMETHLKPYLEEDSRKKKVIVAFECRGMELEAFDIRSGWEVESSISKKVFTDIDLKEKEWFDYDDIGADPISITDICWSFVRLKN